ncbi:hypothetical protein [Pseudarthrobacter cellobiosi]|uniref:hypothetical protein n=1 Tax=Pseudarthrobacter cellobiosi TaxID=2953654 RepID=UPI00208F15EF|nr:hypothetical protein [Pseudarthrobacter sp. HLT1-5]MCO4257366.1 hypothetical protein [Pseudarthrobacter sp. HLT1-5]
MPRLTPDGPSIYPNCGDRAAYYRHLRNGTQPCRPCKNALAKSMDEWRHSTGKVKSRVISDAVIEKHGIKVRA